MTALAAALEDPSGPLPAMPSGGAFALSGWCVPAPGWSLEAVEVDDEPARLVFAEALRPELARDPPPSLASVSPEARAWSGFLAVAGFERAPARSYSVRLKLSGPQGASATHELGDVALQAPAPPEEAPEGDPELVVCMACYRPDPELFRRQIESIRAQTYDRWACVIQDDASSAAAFTEMWGILGEDPRFSMVRNPHNLGFYGNFEAALRRVPASTKYVALADQDDAWHPDKLASLVAELEAGATLAYSDCRIVDRHGAVLAETFWTRKRNNWTDLEELVLRNTVTGAAAACRRDLLEAALPFPRLAGTKLYHDHWLGVAALAAGRLGYVDRPLYDYVQHEGADTGHFDTARRQRRAASDAALPAGASRPLRRLLKLEARLQAERARAVLVLENLLRRLELSPERRATLEGLRDADASVARQAAWLARAGARRGTFRDLGGRVLGERIALAGLRRWLRRRGPEELAALGAS